MEQEPRSESMKERTHRDEKMEGEFLYDSHFHLDRTKSKLGGNWNLNEIPKPLPHHYLPIKGGIINYCDPKTYPSTAEAKDILKGSGRYKIALGVHPSYTKETLNMTDIKRKIGQFKEEGLLGGLGELGFDWEWNNRNKVSLREQEAIVEEMILEAEVDTPLILHVRGERGDLHSQVAYTHCLDFLKGKVNKQQVIQLHCFQGNREIVDTWSREFKNTYFSISGAIKYFDREQHVTLQEIPENRLLLETDSPYLSLGKDRVNTPNNLGILAAKVAYIRRTQVSHVIQQCNLNAQDIFKL